MDIMNPTFDFQVERLGKTSALASISGYLDEHASLDATLIDESIADLVIDFNNLKLVNSIGIKYWVRFVSELEKRPELFITFKNCRKQVIDCCNVVTGFKPSNAKIESFYAPIYCENCDRTIDLLRDPTNYNIDEREIIDAVTDVDCEQFPGCRKHFEVDYDPNTYLRNV